MMDTKYSLNELLDLGVVVTLKEHNEKISAEKDKALIAALVAVKEENRKTETGAEKRFDLLNELRTGVATTEQIEALEKVVAAQGKLLYIGLGGVLALQIVLQFIT